MDLRLHLLESFMARGSDGGSYKVCGYDRLVPDVSLGSTDERWESSGVVEYRLANGQRVEVDGSGTLRIAGSDVTLEPVERGAAVSP